MTDSAKTPAQMDQNKSVYEGRMQEAILSYFAGEKSAGVVLILLAIIGIAMAWIFFQPKYNLRACAIMLAVFSLIEIAIGTGLFLRTDKQLQGLLSQLDSNPQVFSTPT